jgi:Cu(I)/Ag(I) efflux system membrane fusion protein
VRGACALSALLAGSVAVAADVRDHTRMKPDAGTAVSSAQAITMTLTLSPVTVRPVQTWVRGVADLDGSGLILDAVLHEPDARLVAVGQRVRVFSLESRSSMYQARVTHVMPQADRRVVRFALTSKPHIESKDFLFEIVTEQGQYLSVPNEALIDEGEHQIVYVQQSSGDYLPQVVQIGVQGELYSQVLSGVKAGDQVVTIGSFFIDAEHKMKGPD